MTRMMILLLALLCAKPLVAQQANEIKGYNGLYMGHSFFWPSTQELERIVPGSRVVGHRQILLRAGGASGSPGQLWDNEKNREKGQRHLDSKTIDLLVMTYYSPENSSAEHYSKWFDYAIAQNPDTTFMVAIPWAAQLYKADQARLDYLKTVGARLHDSMITKLREKYPANKILYCPYGLGTYELIDRLAEGRLPGVKHLLNMDRATRKVSQAKHEQLLKDERGHPGDLVTKLGALLWLQTLYDYDLTSLKNKRIDVLPNIDLREIATSVSKMIKPFNAVYQEK